MVSGFKNFALALVFTMAISSVGLLVVKPANAQTIPTPSVPNFTLKLVGPSYLQPTTYVYDPNTGGSIVRIGETNQYSYLDVIIENQAFTPYNDSQGHKVQLYYNIQIHDENSMGGYSDLYGSPIYGTDALQTQSTESNTTTVAISIEGVTVYGGNGTYGFLNSGTLYFAGGQFSFEVQAMIGYTITVVNPNNPNDIGQMFTGQISNWSNPQTMSFPQNVPLTSAAAPTAPPNSPFVPEFPSSAFLLLLLVSFSVGFAIKRKMRLKPNGD